MLARDIMEAPVTIDKNEALSNALDLMERKKRRSLLVLSDGELTGVITLREIVRVLGSRRKGSIPATQLHVSTAVSNKYSKILPDTSLSDVIALLKNAEALAVYQSKLAGWITPKEALKAIHLDGYVSEIMSEPINAARSDRVVHARRLMLDRDLGRLPVVEGSKLIGIITETDIARAFKSFRDLVPGMHQDSRVKKLLVEDIMTMDVKYVRTNTLIEDAKKLMLQEDIGGLPVLNLRDEIVGIVTRRNIINAFSTHD
jgi:CBS domain-containing protein